VDSGGTDFYVIVPFRIAICAPMLRISWRTTTLGAARAHKIRRNTGIRRNTAALNAKETVLTLAGITALDRPRRTGFRAK
jgi:hypothetical protein